MKLSVGPLLYLWERSAVLRFYESLCKAPVDIVYLGEVVCGKRRLLPKEEWRSVAGMLRSAGKEVVISTLALIEAESELATLARIIESADAVVEANDYACVEHLAGRPFVAGPHLNIYNEATLKLLARRGAQRWVAPVELPLGIVAALAELRPPKLQVEMFAYGIQTQSAATQNLLPHLHKLRNAGVDVLRLSPQSYDFLDVVHAFHAALSGDRELCSLTQSRRPGTRQPAWLNSAACVDLDQDVHVTRKL